MKILFGISAIILFGLGYGIQKPIQSGGCDPQLMPSSDKDVGYKNRGNRCEGLYIANVSGQIDVVHVTIGDFWNNPASGSLTLSASLAGAKSINIRAQSIPLNRFYRMDSELQSGSEMIWSLTEVVSKVPLSVFQIGLYGWIKKAGNIIYTPVKVHPQTSLLATGTTHSVVVAFRSGKVVANGYWRLFAMNDSKYMQVKGWQTLSDSTPILPGKPIVIRLEQPLPPEFLIELKIRSQGDVTWTRAEAKVLIK